MDLQKKRTFDSIVSSINDNDDDDHDDYATDRPLTGEATIAAAGPVVLGFDIERSGGTDAHDTIAIGASVVDAHFKELDRLFLPGYFPDETKFEARCYDEFWVKHLDALKALTYRGPLSKSEREREMIVEFQSFRERWENYTDAHGMVLELVSDNNVFDGGFINELLFKYLPDSMPIPYNTKRQYKSFWETHSEQRGVLMMVAPDFVKDHNWGYSDKIKELFKVPDAMQRSHDHNPANDAYTIAFEQQILLGIRDGRIALKKNQESRPEPIRVPKVSITGEEAMLFRANFGISNTVPECEMEFVSGPGTPDDPKLMAWYIQYSDGAPRSIRAPPGTMYDEVVEFVGNSEIQFVVRLIKPGHYERCVFNLVRYAGDQSYPLSIEQNVFPSNLDVWKPVYHLRLKFLQLNVKGATKSLS